MDFLIFIALVIIIILLFSIKSLQKEIERRTHQSFLSLKKELMDSGKNLLIIENTTTGGIYNLEFFLKNSSVGRTAELSGSNDRKNWFTIDDNIAISNGFSINHLHI